MEVILQGRKEREKAQDEVSNPSAVSMSPRVILKDVLKELPQKKERKKDSDQVSHAVSFACSTLSCSVEEFEGFHTVQEKAHHTTRSVYDGRFGKLVLLEKVLEDGTRAYVKCVDGDKFTTTCCDFESAHSASCYRHYNKCKKK